MGRNQLDRYLDVVEDSFGAAAAASEDLAADDLALAFLQDLVLAEALLRIGPLEGCLPGMTFQPVIALGQDYAVMDADRLVIFPISGARYRLAASGMRPQVETRSMVGLLRTLVRHGVGADVDHGDGTSRGLLIRAGKDHLCVRMSRGDEVIPLALVTRVTLHGEQKWGF